MIVCHVVIKVFGGLEFRFTQYTLPGHTPLMSDFIFTFLDNFNSWFMLMFSPFAFGLGSCPGGGRQGQGGVVFTLPMNVVTCLFGSIAHSYSCLFTSSSTGMRMGFEGTGVVSPNDDFPRYTSTTSAENTSQFMTVNLNLVLS